jgi:hypothetical protein
VNSSVGISRGQLICLRRREVLRTADDAMAVLNSEWKASTACPLAGWSRSAQFYCWAICPVSAEWLRDWTRYDESVETWLLLGGIGPALVALPVNWAAGTLAGLAKRWFRRLRRSDGLSRIVVAAVGSSSALADGEFDSIRSLLEDERTWVRIGRGPVEDLVALIAGCLPDRTAEDAMAVGRAIARGLLEFAVRDLDPALFQQVLFARLERMEAGQASALDAEMLGVHADLAARFASLDESGAARYTSIMGRLREVLDRLPEGPAGEPEVAFYLATLIRRLSIDPWPHDNQFGGPVLSPAAIERRLRIKDIRRGDQDAEADDLASRCVRLVVLGGPGAGKTWLAKRAARRCAEDALDALAAGASVGEVELPLFTTCSELFSAAGSILEAVVSSALDQLPYLGSACVAALRLLFAQRTGPTVLVLDSLDEASGPDDRLGQADSLPRPWRIILTSRPSSWNDQIVIGHNDDSRRVGVVQALRYPDDVEPFIRHWFAGRAFQGEDLVAQLASRPGLQEAATMPLILAFYCLIGDGQPLPERRSDLYARVIRRMLTGRWRDSRYRDPDTDACLETLRDWAWASAAKNPVSGVGAWAEEIAVSRPRLGDSEREALDHVAMPVRRVVDTGMTVRRFVHRSIREHLVAEHVATRMTEQEAAQELLAHIWYDPDWEYAAPAALAMHPRRDQILAALMSRIAGAGGPDPDLAPVDSCWEVRHFLARVALDSGEADWSSPGPEIIGRARADLLMSGYFAHLGGAGGWPNSNTQLHGLLIGLAAGKNGKTPIRELARALAELSVTADERAQAREALLGLLAEEDDNHLHVRDLAEAVGRLALTAQDRADVREVLFGLLEHAASSYRAWMLADALASMDPPAAEQARARALLLGPLASKAEGWRVKSLARALANFDPPASERAWARQAVLKLLADETDRFEVGGDVEIITRLSVTAEERSQARHAMLAILAADGQDPRNIWILAGGLAGLEPTASDQVQTGHVLLNLLIRATDASRAITLATAMARLGAATGDRNQARQAVLELLPLADDHEKSHGLLAALAELAPAPDERTQTRGRLLVLLTSTGDSTLACDLAATLAGLEATPSELAEARDALLQQIADETWGRFWTRNLMEARAGLNPTEEEQSRARELLLELLSSETRPLDARDLTEALAGLDPTAKQRTHARDALLRLRSSAADSFDAACLARAVAYLAATEEERAFARRGLLAALDHQASSDEALLLATAVISLAPTADERRQARQALLTLLASYDGSFKEGKVAEAIGRLAVTTQDRSQAREALLSLLASQSNVRKTRIMVDAIAAMDATPQDRAQVQEALRDALDHENSARQASSLAEAVAAINPAAHERDRTRHVLLRLLERERDSIEARWLTNALAKLSPAAGELAGWQAWRVQPDSNLLAAVRRNSAVPDWLATLPTLAGLHAL